MATEIKTIKCPLCGWHHPIEQKFGGFDLNEQAFISIREARGRGGGLPEINSN